MKSKLLLCAVIFFHNGMFAMNIMNIEPDCSLQNQGMKHPIKVLYTNYRGETAERIIVPYECFWGKTEYHPEEQWLLRVLDVEKAAERIYALGDIKQWFFE